MGNGNWAACGNLPLKGWDNAAVAAQDVAEAHRREFSSAALQIEVLHYKLAYPFGSAHDIGGINSLISRQQHEMLRVILHSAAGRVKGAEYVVFYCLA